MKNTYDENDFVRCEFESRTTGLHFASYRVRCPRDNSWSDLQCHMTFDNVICAMMPLDIAKHFVTFLAKIEACGGEFGLANIASGAECGCQFTAYADGNFLKFQIRYGGIVLGVMPYAMARLFCNLVRKEIDRLKAVAAQVTSIVEAESPSVIN